LVIVTAFGHFQHLVNERGREVRIIGAQSQQNEHGIGSDRWIRAGDSP
jgi:hypothetical protein